MAVGSLPLEILAADAIHAEIVDAGIVDISNYNLVLVSVEVLAAEQPIEATLAADIVAAETVALELVTEETLAADRLAVAAAASTAAGLLEFSFKTGNLCLETV